MYEPDTIQSTLDVMACLYLCLLQVPTIITLPPLYKHSSSRDTDTLSNLPPNHPRVTQGSGLGSLRGLKALLDEVRKENLRIL